MSESKINPFGSFNFCIDLLEKGGIPRLMDQHLGKRILYVGFDYSQILLNQRTVYFWLNLEILTRRKNQCPKKHCNN
ncbi:MAG: hypothetical protein AAF600_07385 [Bacteroidota bacterium]